LNPKEIPLLSHTPREAVNELMVHRFLQFILSDMFDKHLKGSVIRLCPGVVLTEKA